MVYIAWKTDNCMKWVRLESIKILVAAGECRMRHCTLAKAMCQGSSGCAAGYLSVYLISLFSYCLGQRGGVCWGSCELHGQLTTAKYEVARCSWLRPPEHADSHCIAFALN